MLTLNMAHAKMEENANRRILLLVTQADWGGVQSFLVNFAKSLALDGYEVMLAAGGDGELWKAAEKAGIRTLRLKHMRREINPIQDILAYSEIKTLIDTFKPRAIHLNSSKMGVIGSWAAQKSKTKPRVVYRIGGWSFLEPIPTWKRWLYRTAEKFSAKYKDVIITVHPGDAELAGHIGIRPRENMTTVANGLSENFTCALLARDVARRLLGLPTDAYVFGTVANAYATKNLLTYLDAIKPMHDDHPECRFVIIGDGPELEHLKEKRKALGLDRLNLTGHRDDANTLYRAFDAFVLPSVKEGMPWTLLEAMASGIPIIATDVGANRWMTGPQNEAPAAIITPPGETKDLTTTMELIFGDKNKSAELAHAGPLMVEKYFRWDSTYRGNRDALLGRKP
ncbi:MAG: glycosyltransferase family 4 protein [Patescibacteria group bacterium]|nr:glycosyltransferase family 4 protein [Patescibacteria group bacterium]